MRFSHTAYRILDEPRPGALGALVVNPMLPLLATMLAGAWLGLPWFLLNAFALGSPTRTREAVVVAAVPVSVVAYILVCEAAERAGFIPERGLAYALVGLTVWKLGAAYVLFTWQSRAFAIHEHFGGRVLRQGALGLVGGFLLRVPLLVFLEKRPLLQLLAW